MTLQVMTERRNDQFFCCELLGTLFVRIETATKTAFPVFDGSCFLAGCGSCSVLYQRMLRVFQCKGFCADVSAVTGKIILALLVAGAGFMAFLRHILVHIVMLRNDLHIFSEPAQNILFRCRLHSFLGFAGEE